MSKKRVRPAKSARPAPSSSADRRSRRNFDEEFKSEAVAMLLDGHTAASVAERLGLSSVNLLYRWKREQLDKAGPTATSLEARVRQLELELQRVERERDILKKALAIFGRSV
jgi:transposase